MDTRGWHGDGPIDGRLWVFRSDDTILTIQQTKRKETHAFARCNSDDSKTVLRFDGTILTIAENDAGETYVYERRCQRHVVSVSQANMKKKEVNVLQLLM